MGSRGLIARIALAIPVPDLFDYEVPPSLDAQVVPGARVRVPFGRGVRLGYCIDRATTSEHDKLKAIEAVVDDAPLLEPDLLALIDWTARYYLCSIGEVIEAAVPKAVREGKRRAIRWARLLPAAASFADGGQGANLRTRILETLHDRGPLPLSELLEASEAGESSAKTLAKRGAIEIVRAPTREFGGLPTTADPGSRIADGDGAPWRTPPPYPLTPEQKEAVSGIEEALSPPRFTPFLLEGVTGSGKTEVYLHAIRRALAEGRGALVLLPEISLTPQTVERFRERLGDVAVLHSLLTPVERSMHYGRLRQREVRVAIGARSAIFAPIPDLGLIIVDESHEESYKQENAPRYHARDLAVVRASQLGCPVVLGSATPTLESKENVARGRYTPLSLPRRVTGHGRAQVELVDRRLEPTTDGPPPMLGPKLVMRLRETMERGEQALLFLNRRGFARRIHCGACGFQLQCRECDIGLTYHKHEDRSLCHYCGAVEPVPSTCPDCKAPAIRRSLPGTERIEETLTKLFPEVEVGRLDRDTATSGSRMQEIIARFRAGETRILVGTQMIAKGHDIPGVTMVGVIDADVALGMPDFRAAERTAQLLCQVAGRAGRGEKPGRVVIQTRQPDHYALEAAVRQDLDIVRTKEAAVRKILRYPPYGHLVRVLCEDTQEERAFETATTIRRGSEKLGEAAVELLGPAPAPLGKLRSRYRVHLLLKSPDRAAIHRVAHRIAWAKPRWSTTKVIVDVDPMSLM